MHMADALLSPRVGLTFGAASTAAVAYAAARVRRDLDDRRIPLMGVMGAFIFAAQMINFTIPGTGSSGHLGGGLLLSILLGSHAAFLTLTSVLVVQALFFADGGILALGANIFNLGLFPCFMGGFIYRFLAGGKPRPARMAGAAMAASVCGLEAGAFGVVLETLLSGKSELPFRQFSLVMLGIHLPIGLVEGLVTAAVVAYVMKARPELADPGGNGSRSLAPLVVTILAASFVTATTLPWLASTRPDGLEWSVARVGGGETGESAPSGAAGVLKKLQDKTAFMPDYALKGGAPGPGRQAEGWPAADAGRSLSGLVGSLIVLSAVALVSLALTGWRRRKAAGRRGAGLPGPG